MTSERQPALRKPWFAWLVIVAVTVICATLTYAPFILRGDPHSVAGFYDRWAYFGPMAYFMDYSLHHGEFPLWNPLIFCGVPFAANPQAGAFYPPNLLRSLLTFTPTPLNALIGLEILAGVHLVLACAGSFFFARQHKLTFPASLVVALSYTFGAAMTRRVPDLASFVCMAAWLPVLLSLLHCALHSDSRWRAWRHATACGVVLGISVLVGFPQLSAYIFLTLACYFVLQGIPAAFWRPAARRLAARNASLLVWIFVVASMMAAPLLLPAFEYSHFAPRAKAIGESYRAGTFHVSPLYLLRGLASYPGITYPGSDGIRMAGTGAFLLAIASLFHPRRRGVATFAILFLILLDCSLGEDYPVGGLVAWLAPFKVVVPARASIFGCFMLCMLAGFGTDALLLSTETARKSKALIAFVALPSIGILYLLWRWTSPDPSMAISHIVWFIPALLALIMLVIARTRRFSILIWALPLLVFAETLAWNLQYLPYLISIYPFPGNTEALSQQHQLPTANTRGTDDPELDGKWLCENLGMFSLRPAMGGYDPLYIDQTRKTICPPGREDEYLRETQPGDIARTNQRGNLLLKRRFWLASSYVSGSLPDKNALFPAAATVYLKDATSRSALKSEPTSAPARSVSSAAVATPIPIPNNRIEIPAPALSGPDSVAIASLPRFHVGPRHTALTLHCASAFTGTLHMAFRDADTGRTEFGKDYPIAPATLPTTLEYPLPDMGSIDATVKVTRTDGSGSISLSDLALWEDPADLGGLITIRTTSANSVDLDIGPLPNPAILTFVESAYPGWTALVDGRPSPILRADDAFQAVGLAAGPHTVRFEYRSRFLPAGLTVATTAIVFALGLTLFATKRIAKSPV